MIMILMLCFCFMLYVDKSSSSDENETLNVDIYDNFLGTEHLFYGDLTKMDDMFLPPLESELSETDDIQNEQELAERKEAIFKLKEFDYLRPKVMTPDVAEFNDITRILQNETRRYMGNWRGWADHEDVEAGQLDDMSNLELEYTKKEKMSNMHLQWIVHTRILVQKAFVLRRDDVRTDKRYKIGYLMSRLRIIRYEQQKIASHAAAHEDHYNRNLRALLNYYERMVRYDVDIKAFVLRRDDVRTDKRYKIGYLMSRLRIIRYEQQKIASHAAAHEDHYNRNLRALLNYYERMVRYDVDIKDTVNFIKELDKEPIPKIADTSTPPTRR